MHGKRNDVIRLVKDIAIRKESFGALIYDRKGYRFYKVNNMGHYIFELISKAEFSIERLVGKLVEEFHEDREVVEKDVIEFLKELNKRGLIREV